MADGIRRWYCRSPHGERGLKYRRRHRLRRGTGSRSPHGERGLKFQPVERHLRGSGRSPHGERGLKYIPAHAPSLQPRVALLTESVD